jgi:hypothetical protein
MKYEIFLENIILIDTKNLRENFVFLILMKRSNKRMEIRRGDGEGEEEIRRSDIYAGIRFNNFSFMPQMSTF